jgi:DNA invertase Pin-like site-specific DNA recombinase
MDDRKIIRCAVYTRKSTEEGLEQEFNSLDAQREAGSAYILSQRHEGWVEVAERYDDGGYSGGNMERPGLKRLLADIASGKVDTIVVYKVDRLTRALTDFARIVEVLDARGASFVSVTQSLNSTTSMGRLTLNVLLSFAQFEREVTGERIRDKIAASKRKGMFMGGLRQLDTTFRTVSSSSTKLKLPPCGTFSPAMPSSARCATWSRSSARVATAPGCARSPTAWSAAYRSRAARCVTCCLVPSISARWHIRVRCTKESTSRLSRMICGHVSSSAPQITGLATGVPATATAPAYWLVFCAMDTAGA